LSNSSPENYFGVFAHAHFISIFYLAAQLRIAEGRKELYDEPSETNKMLELGNVQHAAQGMRALKLPRHEMPDPTEKTATIKIADEAAAAVIRHRFYAQDVEDGRSADTPFSPSDPASNVSQTKVTSPTSESSPYSVYTDPGQLVTKLRKEIEAINSFDGFLIGVHDKIDEFSKHTEFSLDQVLDVEQRIAKLNQTLELSKFSLPRVKAEAFKVVRCQGNLGPARALLLLRDNIAKLNNAKQAKGQPDSEPEQNG